MKYLKSYFKFLSNQYFDRSSNEVLAYDLVFIIPEHTRGWVLDAICREIANYFPGKYCFHGTFEKLPPAHNYFFCHYAFLAPYLLLNPPLWGRNTFVFYTHPKGEMSDEQFVYLMSKSTKVISMCSIFARRMVNNCGLSPSKVTSVIGGGADPDVFKPHQRSQQAAVGFCSAYYARKSPDRIFNIVKLLPHRKFILIGKNWQQYEKYDELVSLPNFNYVQIPYADYPYYYAQMDVFVSPAILEGGPIPLIEAMMCNVFPVASKTGFAPDIIKDGENGFLFDLDASAEEICELVEQAFQVDKDIRQTVEHLSWQNFSLEIQRVMQEAIL